MLRDDMVSESGGVYRLTAKGWTWARSLGAAGNSSRWKRGAEAEC